MQRLFSMFPNGGPGLALILLRMSVVATLVSCAPSHPGWSSSGAVFAGILVASLALTIGFLTPYLCAVACVAAAVCAWMDPDSGQLVHAVAMLDAAALALLGPGAYSVDARLFGRRVTVVLPGTDSKRD